MPSDDGYVRIVVHVEGGVLSIVEARILPGLLATTDAVASGLAHEVLLGGRRIALGSMPGVGICGSSLRDTFDFVVRVPRAALRGRDLSSLELRLVAVPSSSDEPESTDRLRCDADVHADLVASFRPASVDELPEALRLAADP